MTARKIELMHLQFGVCGDLGATSKTCEHLIRHSQNRVYYKCEVYGDTRSEASDWKVSNRACGMYNKPYSGNPAIRLVKPLPKVEQPIDGQESIWDLEAMYNALDVWR